jgi:DNA mismatch repair protein MutS
VARLAGMPPALLRHARGALEHLEAERIARQPQIDLFAAAAAAAGDATAADDGGKRAAGAVANSALGEAIAALDPDILTPREALDALYRLKALQRDTS